MPLTNSRLFAPLTVGNVSVSTRIVMGPLGSNLADNKHVLDANAAAEYYGRRAREPGTLIIGEATFISPQASGSTERRAGIWTEEQIAAWKRVVDSVHDAGSFIFLQLWALGRSADPVCKQRDGTGDVVSSSAVPESKDGHVPRPLTEDEIWTYIRDYARAAKNAVENAGFDGVEIHGGNGSLIDQFLQHVVNKRNDAWGGSVQKRSRFALEVVKAVCEAIDPTRVGVRLSPYSTYAGMGMAKDDTISQFTDVLSGFKSNGLAYVHLVESRIAGRKDVQAGESLEPFLEIWPNTTPLILAGGYSAEEAAETVEKYPEKLMLVAFGRAFVVNPDLVSRVKNGIPLLES